MAWHAINRQGYMQHRSPARRFPKLPPGAAFDWLSAAISYYVVPLAILVFSVLVFIFQPSVYGHHTQGEAVLFQSLPQAPGLDTPETVLPVLKTRPLEAFLDLRLSEVPHWFTFAVPARLAADADAAIEFPSRHAREIACWNAADAAPVGGADRERDWGAFSAAKAGFSLALEAAGAPAQLVCRATFSGPARLTVVAWQDDALAASERAFEHATGVLEGGLLTLAALTFMTALITRESRYVLFAVWLIGNLRLGGISMGFDTQWLTRTIPADWMDTVRQLTIAIYYIITYTLFGQFLRTELSRVGYAWLFRFASRAGLVLLVLALVLDFSSFLPAMWVIVSFSIVVVTFFLARIAVVTRSRIAVWYAVALAIVFVSTLSEVVAAAFGFKLVLGMLNSVTAALAASLVAAFAFAEQIRLERQERQDAQAELHRTYETTPVGLFTLDAEGRFVRCNAALKELLGLPAGPPNARWGTFFEPDAWVRLREIVRQGGEAEIRGAPRPDGSARWYLVRAAQAQSHIEGSLQDITERREATDRLRFIAHNDSLTGVLNRRGIESKLDSVIRHPDREGPLALAYLDLDRFKLINDLYGHQAGDEVLKQVCERVQGLLGPGQHMGRVGGDEFILVMRRTSMAEAAALTRRVFDAVCGSPYRLRRRAFQVRTSIGLIEVAPGMRAQDAISAADRACREAKLGTHGHVVTYERDDPAFQARIEELRLIEALGSTFSPTGLLLMMQPIMSLHAPESSLDFEVLLRMREPDGTILPAGRVIAAAEANGTIGELDKWVLESTLTWLLQHHADLPNTRFVCVNLSGASINDESFMADTYRILERFPSVVPFLCIEITESVALHDIDNSRRFIEQLQRLGARIALDDFGAGYTSFSYLKEFSAHALKIDGAFIQSMQAHPANAAILEAIVELARNLGMRSIAEWVEDYDTLAALAAIGVDYVQGFVVAPPMTPDRLLTGTSAASFATDARVLAFVKARTADIPDVSPSGYLH